MNVAALADDLRYKSLLHKIETLERRLAKLEGHARKKRNRAASPMVKIDRRSKEMAEICQPIADAYMMTLDELRGRAPMNGCRARSDAMKACRDAGFGLTVIGLYFDGRDHSTIRYALGLK
jgi:chromosomal replication initiation ATPase DnaA